MAKLYLQREACRCLECGNELGRYGRTDRKFCSPHCRYEYHNHKTRPSMQQRTRILKVLEKNYAILRSLLESGVEELPLGQLAALGYELSCVTSAIRVRRHFEMGVFDIHYIQSDTRISGIKIVSLTLPRKK